MNKIDKTAILGFLVVLGCGIIGATSNSAYWLVVVIAIVCITIVFLQSKDNE